MNILIPMAGLGSRFAKAGYEKPKPFIDVAGKPMISRVMENLHVYGARFILVAQREHLKKEAGLVKDILDKYDVRFVSIDGVTEGTACTVLVAQEYINNDTPLLIANADQIVDMDIADFIKDAQERNLDGSILCFRDDNRDPKWSFAKTDMNDLVTQVKEKEAISDMATTGIYYFATGLSFVESANRMIEVDDRVNGEFYTCPTYNYMIDKNLRIGVYELPESSMHGIGTPNDLNNYLNSYFSN